MACPVSCRRARFGARGWRVPLAACVLALGACGGGGGDASGLTSAPSAIGMPAPLPVLPNPVLPITTTPLPVQPPTGTLPITTTTTTPPLAPLPAQLYAWVLLDGAGEATPAGLNGSGQVAFTALTPAGPRARFFDGTSTQDIGGAFFGRAEAVNDAGQVAGELLQPSGGSRAFAWRASAPGALTVFDVQPGPFMAVSGINRSGLVVGTLTQRDLPTPFLWQPGGLLQGLPQVEPATAPPRAASGLFINSAGAVAGLSSVPAGGTHAVLWLPGAPARDLGTLGGAASAPAGLNDANQVAGQADLADGSHHAVRWSEAEGLRDLGTLGGPNSAARAINAGGAVAGTADTAAGTSNAFLWRDGSMQSLGTLGGAQSEATVVNTAGQVGGSAATAAGVPHAFLWSAASGMVDLNDRVANPPAPELRTVLALADDGALLVASSAGLVLLRPRAP